MPERTPQQWERRRVRAIRATTACIAGALAFFLVGVLHMSWWLPPVAYAALAGGAVVFAVVAIRAVEGAHLARDREEADRG